LKIDEGAVDRSVCGALDDAGVRRSFHPRIAARGYQYAHDVLDMEEVERLFG
jgi:hypothetical protein